MSGLGLGLRLGCKGRGFDPAPYTWVATDGNDTIGDGTFANPYKTLMKAEGLTLTGTKATIYVKPGTYKANHVFAKAYNWKAYGSVVLQGTGNYCLSVTGTTAFNMSGFIFDMENTKFYALYIGAANADCKNKTFNSCKFINPLITGAFMTDVADSTDAKENSNIVFNGCSYTGASNRVCNFGKSGIGFTFDGCTFNHVPSGTAGTGTSIRLSSNAFNASGLADIKILNSNIILTAGSNGDARFMNIGKKGSYTFTGNTFTHASDHTNNYGIIQSGVLGDSATGEVLDTNTFIFNNNTINGGTYNLGLGDFGWIHLVGDNKSYMSVQAKNNIMMINNALTERSFIRATNMLNYDIDSNSLTLLGDRAANKTFYGLIRAGRGVVPASSKKVVSAVIKRNYIYAPTSVNGYGICWGEDANPGNTGYADFQDGAIIQDNYIEFGAVSVASGAHAILCGFCKDNQVYRNKLVNCGLAIALKGADDENAYTSGGIRYNVIINTKYGIGLSSVSATIANNVIIQTEPIINSMVFAYFDQGTDMPTLTMYNNILIATNHNNQPMIILNNANGIVANNNAYSTAGILLRNIDGETVTDYTIDQWIALESQDQNSLKTVTNVNNLTGIPSSNSNVNGAGLTLEGTGYNVGLDIASVFPAKVITKEQDTDWDIGAFVIGE